MLVALSVFLLLSIKFSLFLSQYVYFFEVVTKTNKQKKQSAKVRAKCGSLTAQQCSCDSKKPKIQKKEKAQNAQVRNVYLDARAHVTRF
jgi:hypothetical protein